MIRLAEYDTNNYRYQYLGKDLRDRVERWKKQYGDESARLKELLTKEEWDAAKGSTVRMAFPA